MSPTMRLGIRYQKCDRERDLHFVSAFRHCKSIIVVVRPVVVVVAESLIRLTTVPSE